MKRFLSMLATLVLVGQSVVTPLVYATDFVNENEETVPVASVEIEVADPVSDESDDNEVAADVDNPMDDAEEFAESEESADAEESVKAEDSDTLEESKTTEDTETSEVVDAEKVEEESVVAEPEVKTTGVESTNVVEESVSYPAAEFEGHDGLIQVNASAEEGVFPEGTTMKVSQITTSEAEDIAKEELGDAVKSAIGVDISFRDVDGNEIEPRNAQDVHISVSLINRSFVKDMKDDNLTVVHQDNDGNTQSIQNVEVEKGHAEATAEFDHNHFSIFVFVIEKFKLINFKNGNDVITGIYLKDASEASSLIFDPGVGELGEGQVFRGWTFDENYTKDTTPMTITGVQNYISGNFATFETGVDIYAMIFNQYTVTYKAPNGTIVETEEVLYEDGEEVTYTINANYTAGEYEFFTGWTDGTTVYQLGSEIKNLSGDLVLTAVVKKGHWLVFDEVLKGATYNAPQFVETNDVTKEPSLEMKRLGYTFDGWYTEKEYTNKFIFGKKITENATVYAKWNTGETANYTVLIWKQHVDGKSYDFWTGKTYEGTVGSGIDNIVSENSDGSATINSVRYSEGGFHYKNFDGDITIKPEGNSVVNVYFDRNEIKFIFNTYEYTYTEVNGNNGTQYGLVDGEYVELTRGYDGRWYYYSGGWHGYTGTRYTRSDRKSWREYKTMTGLYGSTLADNNYEWPTENDWYSSYDGGDAEGTRTTFLDAFLPASTATTVNFYGKSTEGSNHVYFYQQNADKNGYTLKNTINTNAEGFHLSDKYNGFKCVAWNSSNDTGSRTKVGSLMNQNGNYYYDAKPSQGGYQTADIGRNGLHVYFDRLAYTINFMDGAYVNGNGAPINETNRGQLDVVDNVTYGSDVSSYNNNTPKNIPAGYVFEGWYLDDAGTHPYTFTTMPEGGLTVYAKWRQIQYRVFLHPKTTDSSLSWGDEAQAMNFRVSYLDKVSVPYGTRDGYEFVGWYTDSDLKNAFNGDTRLTEELKGLTTYNKTEDMTDPMDKYGNGATWNSDIIGYDDDNDEETPGKDRFWITKKLDLYAKWRSTLSGANGINVVYKELNNVDDTLYVDGAEAIAFAAPSNAPAGQQFKYWVVQKWNGTEFVDTDPEIKVYPGASFEVLKGNAKEESVTDAEHPEVTKKYTVQLRAEYGPIESAEKTTIEYYDEGLLTTQTINVNEEFTLSGALEKEGYTFKEWNTQENGEGTGYKAGATGYAADNVDTTGNVNKLYAQWTPNTYVVKFNSNGGEGNMDNQNFTYDVEQALTSNAFTKAGYVFNGWKKGEESYTDGQRVKNLTTVNEGEVELVAQWIIDNNQTKELSYTVEYYKDNVKVDADTVVKTGSVQVLEPDTLTFDKDLINESKYVGYELEKPDPDSVEDTVKDGDIIRVYYVKKTNLNYTVNYLEKDTDKVLKTAKTGQATFEEEITAESEKVAIDGYNYDSSNPESIKISATGSDNVINLYYTKRNDLSYVVHYYEKDSTTRVADDKTGDNKTFGETINESAINIAGYTKVDPTTATITIDTDLDKNVIIFYYEKRTDLSYTVNYLDKDTNVAIKDPKMVDKQEFGTKITSVDEKVEISGYNYDSVSPETLTIAEENNVINVYYTKKNDLSYVVHYYEEGTTNKVAEDKTMGNQTFGAEVKENAISIDGYNTTGDTEKTIRIAEEGNEIVFYYVKRTDLSYTVYYKEQETNKELTGAKTVGNQTFENKVTENAVIIEGYTVVDPSTAEIEITTGTNEYTFYYTANNNTKYTVEHYFKGTGENAVYVIDENKTQIFEGTTNEEVRANPLTEGIEGFRFDEDNENNELTGIIAANGSLVLKVYYDRVKVNVKVDPKDPECDNNSKECIEPTEGEKEYGDEVTLPYVKRSYTLAYEVGNGAPEVESQNVESEIDYYCMGNTSDCEEGNRVLLEGADKKVEVTGAVTYTAHYSKSFEVIVKTGANYQTATTGYTFKTWKDGETPVATGSKLTLTGDKTLVAEYGEEVQKYEVIIDPNCDTEEEVCGNVTTGEVVYGSTGTLPELERSYTLTYEEAKEVENPLSLVEVSLNLLGYCKDEVKCEKPIAVGTEYEVTGNVKYYAVWSGELKVIVTTGAGYETAEKIYTFKEWKDGESTVNGGEELTLTGDKTLVAEYDGECATGYEDVDGKCTIKTFTVTFNSDGGSAVSGQTVEYGKTATKPADPTKSSNTFQGWTLSGQAFDFSTPITGDITLIAKWKSNGGGGGGGGGGGSSTYPCKELTIAHAKANDERTRDSSQTDYSYGTGAGCTFQCEAGYTYNSDKNTCEKSGGTSGGGNNDEEIELGGQVSDKCSVEGFNGSEEEKAAYLYACENDITTIRDINEARLKDFLTRAEMAKMVSVFATKELGMKPNTSKDCSNFANSISHYNQEMKDYMVMSCQLELMGIHTVNYEPIPDFMPSKRVSRAEFGTVLSRVLWGNKYEGTNSNYYINHLNALKENNIITNINPNITEYRAWVFLMLYRAVEAIKVLKSTNNVAIDQQVNEELQEEGKAETGLVIEYDSGSVVPDMATLTESGTLATGAVAEVESGSVVESQTGATTTLTGEDASKEVSAETGAVAETGSTSN